MSRLHLEGPLFAWSDTALAAHLGEGEDARPVMVFLGPEATLGEPHSPSEAAVWVGRKHPGVVHLVDVQTLGTRSAWIHDRVDALGLTHLVDAPESRFVPLRVAAELVAAVADLLASLGSEATEHPGPGPEHLALGPTGAVHLVGFGSPWPAAPVARDPSGGTANERLIWRLGVLLAQLLGGRIPAVSDRSAHKAMLRRVLIRAMARSGPIFSERYRDWLAGMLAWEADQRPPLSSIGAGLREMAARLGGDDLPTWSAAEIPGRIALAQERGEVLEITQDAEVSYHPWNVDADVSEDAPTLHPLDISGRRTLPGIPLSALQTLDDVTAESTLVRGVHPPGLSRPEPGTIPVSVGPPAEAMRRRPSLPSDFLDGPVDDSPLDPEASPAVLARLFLLVLLGGVITGLILLLAALLVVNPY